MRVGELTKVLEFFIVQLPIDIVSIDLDKFIFTVQLIFIKSNTT